MHALPLHKLCPAKASLATAYLQGPRTEIWPEYILYTFSKSCAMAYCWAY